jgi:hypothetical protein
MRYALQMWLWKFDKTRQKMNIERIELNESLNIFAYILVIFALLGAVAMIIRLLIFRRIPGKRIHVLMLITQILNLVWHSVGAYSTFTDIRNLGISKLHFWIGCKVVLLNFIIQWEILRLFESVTHFASANIYWCQFATVVIYAILAFVNVLSDTKTIEPLPLWNQYWLVGFLFYYGFTILWLKVYISLKLYKSMLDVSCHIEKQRKIKRNYKILILQNIALWLCEPISATLWIYGWVIEQDFVKKICYLKIGEANMTYQLIISVYFLEKLIQFKFGDQKLGNTPVSPIQASVLCVETDTKLIERIE